MANNKTIGLIFGVLGGASLDGHSGREIKKNIHEICKKLSGPEGKKYTGIEFHASQASLTKLRKDVENTLQNIQVNVNTNVNGGEPGGGSGSSGGRQTRRSRNGGGTDNPFAAEYRSLRNVIHLLQQYDYYITKAQGSPADGNKQFRFYEAAQRYIGDIQNEINSFNLDETSIEAFIAHIRTLNDDGSAAFQNLIQQVERLEELLYRRQVNTDAYFTGLFDQTTTKEQKDAVDSIIRSYDRVYKLREQAGKKRLDGNIVGAEYDESLAADWLLDIYEQEQQLQLTDEQRLKIEKKRQDAYRKSTEEIGRYEARLKGLAETEKTASANADDGEAQKLRKAQLDSVFEKYRSFYDLQKDIINMPDGADTSAIDKLASDLWDQAERECADYNLTAAESIKLTTLMAKAELDLAKAIALRESKSEDNADEEPAMLKNASKLFAIQEKLLSFQQKHSSYSNQRYLETDRLKNFNEAFESVKQSFSELTKGSQDFNAIFENIPQEEVDKLLVRINNLIKALDTANKEAGDTPKNIIKNQNSMDKLANRATDYYNRIKATLARNPELDRQMQQLIQDLHNGYNGKSVTEASAAFQKLQFQIKQAGLESENLWQTVNRIMKTKLGYGLAGAAALRLRQTLSQVYRNVVDIDVKMTDLKIVSGETGREMTKVLNDAADAAKRVSAAITDIIDATTVYNRLGFNVDTSLKFAELTTMYSKVGDVEIGEAENNLTAIIKAFDFDTAEELSLAMDQLVETANKFASDAQGLGSGLQDAASALTAAGNSYEESLALLTAANTITQD